MAEHCLPGRLVCCITLITFPSFNNCDTREGRTQLFVWVKAGNYLREEAVKPALRTQVVAMGQEARQEREQRGCSCASKLIYRVITMMVNCIHLPETIWLWESVILGPHLQGEGAEGLVFLRLGGCICTSLI